MAQNLQMEQVTQELIRELNESRARVQGLWTLRHGTGPVDNGRPSEMARFCRVALAATIKDMRSRYTAALATFFRLND